MASLMLRPSMRKPSGVMTDACEAGGSATTAAAGDGSTSRTRRSLGATRGCCFIQSRSELSRTSSFAAEAPRPKPEADSSWPLAAMRALSAVVNWRRGRRGGCIKPRVGGAQIGVQSCEGEHVLKLEQSHHVRTLIYNCKHLVVLISENTHTSKRIGWELGLADGLHDIRSVATFPIKPSRLRSRLGDARLLRALPRDPVRKTGKYWTLSGWLQL